MKRLEPNLLRGINLSEMTGGQIAGMLKDLSAMRQWHIRCQQIIADAISLLNTEQCRRTASHEQLLVTDHAVVRYLERVEGMDIEAIRATIEKQADSDCTDGFVALSKGGRVQTVLTEEMAAVAKHYSQ